MEFWEIKFFLVFFLSFLFYLIKKMRLSVREGLVPMAVVERRGLNDVLVEIGQGGHRSAVVAVASGWMMVSGEGRRREVQQAAGVRILRSSAELRGHQGTHAPGRGHQSAACRRIVDAVVEEELVAQRETVGLQFAQQVASADSAVVVV